MKRLPALLIVMLMAPAALATKAPRPTGPVALDTCLRAECHADIASAAVVHGPISTSACDACHELASAESHTYKLTREKAELCTYCHEFDLSAMPVVHKPAKLGECIGCHDPHAGSSKALLRESSVAATCKRCHDDITHGKTFLHTPVKEGACDSCHPPHGSRFPKLLDLAGTDLCLACHQGMEASLAKVKFTHDAMKQGCRKCHDPHGSSSAMSTTQPTVAQCGGCHGKINADAANARFQHTPVLSDRACVGCHTPHGASLAKLLLDTPDKLCMTCHVKDVKTTGDRVVRAVAELSTTQPVKHGGIKDGSCAGCHLSHGGSRQLFLARNYTTGFYQRFAPAQYELCFSCHDARLVTETRTGKLTGFRNGEQNLHALHVRDTGVRGENCRNCHATHAGPNHAMVRGIITYGRWKMPMRFASTPTGGSCFPGCHPRYGYDRQTAVTNTPGAATTLPTSIPVRQEAPAKIVLDATDVKGAVARIPHGTLPVIVHLVNAASPPPFAQLATEARVFVIATGPSAAEHAKHLAAKTGWSILADTDGTLAAELGVHGFPTTLVLRADGLEIARLAGVSESLALKLPAYLDLAAGRIDSAAAAEKLAVRDLVSDGPAKQSARDVRRVEFLLDTGQPEAALKILVALPADALPNWRHNLLGARALMALNRWTEAKTAAQTAVKQNPASPDAHFVLGQVYEHEENWRAATAEFRAARPGN